MKLTLSHEEEKALLLLMGATAVFDEISLKRAYRKKVKTSHPDMASQLGKDPVLMKIQFQEINEAFHLLLEKVRKDNSEYVKSVYRKARPGAYKPTSQSTRTQHRKAEPQWQGSHHKNASRPTSGKKKSPRNSMNGKYYHGPIPTRMLRFAEYLYYIGDVTWDELVRSLVWQYRNRPKLGELAENLGILDQARVIHIIKNRKFTEKFGEAAIRLGVLSRMDVDKLVRQQKMIGLPIGKFFLEKHILSEEQLYRRLLTCHHHNQLQQNN